ELAEVGAGDEPVGIVGERRDREQVGFGVLGLDWRAIAAGAHDEQLGLGGPGLEAIETLVLRVLVDGLEEQRLGHGGAALRRPRARGQRADNAGPADAELRARLAADAAGEVGRARAVDGDLPDVIAVVEEDMPGVARPAGETVGRRLAGLVPGLDE